MRSKSKFGRGEKPSQNNELGAPTPKPSKAVVFRKRGRGAEAQRRTETLKLRPLIFPFFKPCSARSDFARAIAT